MTTTIKPDEFEFGLTRITDGDLFERFAQAFTAAVQGCNFVPVGGIHDRAIDGLDHIFTKTSIEQRIYQTSIEKNSRQKIRKTITALKKNKININYLIYITNIYVDKIDNMAEEIFDEFGIPIIVRDLRWFIANANDSEGTINAYNVHILSNMHEFAKPGKAFVIDDLSKDSRLYVFLRQMHEEESNLPLDCQLADSLLLYSLEGTDPDKKIFMTYEEIISKITGLITFEPSKLITKLHERLECLTHRPNLRIQYHPHIKGYCLPYDQRVELQGKNIHDAAIESKFQDNISKKIATLLSDKKTNIPEIINLISTIIHNLFYQQGLEFSSFLTTHESDSVSKYLPDLIGRAVDESARFPKNKDELKAVILEAMRDVIYNGSEEDQEYFSRLSQTYMMLFLLRCDPKLSTYFSSMASKLVVYTCTSIILPAMSELFLPVRNKRYTQLLQGAKQAGVKLFVNDTILNELSGHFIMTKRLYNNTYKEYEQAYINSEAKSLLVNEILIRSYFYAKCSGIRFNFNDFIDNYVDPDYTTLRNDLIIWLREELGIEYKEDPDLSKEINYSDENEIVNYLVTRYNKDERRSRSDASLVLLIHALRKVGNEPHDGDLFGYNTWWLSTDQMTHIAINAALPNSNYKKCYLRPDFLSYYISLTPNKANVKDMYKRIFPSVLGIGLSANLNPEILTYIQQKLSDFRTKNPSRVTAIIGRLANEIRMQPQRFTNKHIDYFFSERLKELKSER